MRPYTCLIRFLPQAYSYDRLEQQTKYSQLAENHGYFRLYYRSTFGISH